MRFTCVIFSIYSRRMIFSIWPSAAGRRSSNRSEDNSRVAEELIQDERFLGDLKTHQIARGDDTDDALVAAARLLFSIH